MRTKPSLTSADAHKMMAACKEEAQKNNWKVSIVIVDDTAVPLLLERLEGAGTRSPEVALGKARTAALTRQLRNRTGNFQTRIRKNCSRNREFSREMLRF